MTTPASETTPVAVPELVPAPLAPAPAAPAMHAVQPAVPTPVAAEPEPGWKQQASWDHDLIAFKGDQLAIRYPTSAACQGYAFAAGPGSTGREQTYYTRLFLQRHLSPESFNRVMDRMINPDDAEYADEGVLGELTTAMSKPLVDRIKAANNNADG